MWSRSEQVVCGTRLSWIEREMAVAESGPPILLLHGLVAEAETFRKLGEQIPSERRVVAVDLPGAGFSDRPERSDASFTGVAAVVCELMAALGMRKPVVLGHSYGGAVALRLAASFPELLDGLILLSPAHPFSHREDQLVRFYLSRAGRLFARALPRVPRAVFRFAFRRMPGPRNHLSDQEIEPYLHTLRGPGTIAYLLRLLGCWRADMAQLEADLERYPIVTPTLLLWGDGDAIVPSSSGAELLRRLAKAEQVTLPGVGHLPNEECPEECGALIRTWLIWRERQRGNSREARVG